MTARLAFKPDSLELELALRGLSIEAFAELIGSDRSTVERAMKGRKVSAITFGKIIKKLGEMPRLEVPEGLVEEMA